MRAKSTQRVDRKKKTKVVKMEKGDKRKNTSFLYIHHSTHSNIYSSKTTKTFNIKSIANTSTRHSTPKNLSACHHRCTRHHHNHKGGHVLPFFLTFFSFFYFLSSIFCFCYNTLLVSLYKVALQLPLFLSHTW